MRLLIVAGLFIYSLAAAAPDPTPYPFRPSPKGLQVQMVDDLLELGVHHAGINLTLNGLLSPAKEAKPGQPTASADGFTFVINEAYVRSLDRLIKPLSDKGVVVTADPHHLPLPERTHPHAYDTPSGRRDEGHDHGSEHGHARRTGPATKL